MQRNLVSTHKLLTDYGTKAKIKTIVIGWSIFAVLLVATRIPAVRNAMMQFSGSVDVDWVAGIVKFLTSGFWFLAIPLAIGTFITLSKKQTFDELRVYGSGLGFFDGREGAERYADYADVKLSYGSLRQSFRVESKAAGVKYADYGWGEFSGADVLRSNLERYGKWNT